MAKANMLIANLLKTVFFLLDKNNIYLFFYSHFERRINHDILIITMQCNVYFDFLFMNTNIS